MKPRISMITLGVRDLPAAVQFYEQGLGFPRMESEPEVAFFTLNGTWLGLYGRDALAEDATVSPQGEGFEAFTLAHNVHSEQEVDANPIPEAYSVPIKFIPERIDEVPADRPVRVFCGSGIRSAIVASLMQRAGRRNASVVLGGLAGWNSASCPLPLA